jgi:hypothetical protein
MIAKARSEFFWTIPTPWRFLPPRLLSSLLAPVDFSAPKSIFEAVFWPETLFVPFLSLIFGFWARVLDFRGSKAAEQG